MNCIECDSTYPNPDDQAEQILASPVLSRERGKCAGSGVGGFHPILELIEISLPLVRFLCESHPVAWNVGSRRLKSVHVKDYDAGNGETELGSSKAIKKPTEGR